ncbi:recombinase family protein [bacterium]|nr:recombinase family protein [bacterium]
MCKNKKADTVGIDFCIFIKWLSSAYRKRTKLPRLFISNIEQLAPIKSLKNEDFLRQKYLEEGLSLQEIAAETVSSWKTVRRHILYSNIPLKPQDRLVKDQIKFGFKRLEGRLENDAAEWQAIELILRLRKLGKTYREIVNELNIAGVPTRKIGGRWHLKTVYQITSNFSN